MRSVGTFVFFFLIGLIYFLYFSIGQPITQNNSTETTLLKTAPCEGVLTYRIGTIDDQYDISKSELTQVMKKVESLWEKSIDKNLLQYKKDGSITIHLIYGEEQQRSENERQLSQRIQTLKDRTEMTRKAFKRLSKSYKERVEQMEKALSKYNEAASEFNKKIKEWEKNGGIPRSKKSQIEKMQRELKQLQHKAKRIKSNTESLRKQANAKSRQLNRLVERQNEMIAEYNSRFSKVERFDQGQYRVVDNEKRINIYQFGNKAELTTVLAHETGHALGLDHVDNPKSIMHAVMDKQNIFDLRLTKEDIAALQKNCHN
nr:matrixin family metalloprotease [Fodinibius halophilus]